MHVFGSIDIPLDRLELSFPVYRLGRVLGQS